jgi:hypothetical protein
LDNSIYSGIEFQLLLTLSDSGTIRINRIAGFNRHPSCRLREIFVACAGRKEVAI